MHISRLKCIVTLCNTQSMRCFVSWQSVCGVQARTCTGLMDQSSCTKNPQCGYNPFAKACTKVPTAKTGKDAYGDKLKSLMVRPLI